MSSSKLSAVDALTGGKVPLATFDDQTGNTVVGHVALTGTLLSPVSSDNPLAVADDVLASLVAQVATSAGQASTQATLSQILAKLDTLGIAGNVAVQDVAVAAGLQSVTASTTDVGTATGTPTDTAWTGTGSGTLVSLLKALYAKLTGTLQTSLVGPLPAGPNAIGTVAVSNLPATQPVSGNVGVTGLVTVQDSAAEASLGAIVSSLANTLSVQQTSQLPAGANTLGGVQARNGLTINQSVVTIPAGSSVQLLGANTNRKFCGFFLITTGAIGYLNLGAAATSANGLPFGQGSQFGYAYTWDGCGVPTNALFMTATSNATVVVWEGL